jgi:peptidyl-dipeptidase Dcp
MNNLANHLSNSNNPFLIAFQNKSWGTRDNSIPFSRIKKEHFLPALEEGIAQARSKIAEIKAQSQAPDFENTVLALEHCSELMEAVASVYFNLFSAEANAELQALAREISPRSAAFASEVNLDGQLFQRVKAVYAAMKANPSGLTSEDQMLIQKTYLGFTRNGALLADAQKEVLRQIDQELSTLSPQFSEHVLKSTNAFELVLHDKVDLVGLPESICEAMAAEALARGHKAAWLVSLQAPSYIPFMQYSSRRDLREKMWRAYNSRAFEGENSNKEIILKTVRLRDQRAKVLGFTNHAAFTLAERMAESQDRVSSFLQRLLKASKPAAESDLKELREFAQSFDGTKDIKAWDFGYYSEKLKEKKYSFNEEELRPYFSLDKVVEGVFEHARKLYGLKFTPVTDVQTYHPDVKAFEVTDSNSKYVGLFYTDFFPRETKKDGAWMTSYRDQGVSFGDVRRPHISIVCNFTKPSTTKPSLLSYDEVTTLFHEFGHALHGLLSQVTHKSLAGTSVYWDFVELPSQIMENWVKEKEGLDIFARHYLTGEKIPVELVEKIKRSQRFQAGYYSLRQINFAMLDMAWYSTNPDSIRDVIEFENQATAASRLFAYEPGTCQSSAFSHIFAGGYAAGYYSYKWAEVLDADAFEYFKEKGIFNPEVAQLFKENILSKGGTEHPMELYKKFRGREPDPDSLLRRDGLIS